MNPARTAVTREDQIIRAQMMARTLGRKGQSRTGVYYAARYLRARQWSIEAAMLILLGPEACERVNAVEAV